MMKFMIFSLLYDPPGFRESVRHVMHQPLQDPVKFSIATAQRI